MDLPQRAANSSTVPSPKVSKQPKRGAAKKKREAPKKKPTEDEQAFSPWGQSETADGPSSSSTEGSEDDYATLEGILTEPISHQPFVQVRKPKKKSRAKEKGKKLPWHTLSDEEVKGSARMERALAISKAKRKMQ